MKSLHQIQLVSSIVMGCVLFFHLFPALIMWIYQKKKSNKPARGIWKTYLIWYIMLPVLILPILFGQIPFIILCYLLSLFGFRELSQHTELTENKVLKWCIQIVITGLYAALVIGNTTYINLVYICAFILIVIVSLIASDYKNYLKKVSVSVYSFIYCGFLLSYLVLLRQYENGIIYVFIFFILIINNDAFSYIIGFFIGKHKLVPNLSPNKSIEGTIGGIAATVIIGHVLHLVYQLEISSLKMTGLCILLAIGGTIGDLAMSAIKRDLGLKDFSKLIPGHGGLLDRLDSSLLIAPVYYYFCLFIL